VGNNPSRVAYTDDRIGAHVKHRRDRRLRRTVVKNATCSRCHPAGQIRTARARRLQDNSLTTAWTSPGRVAAPVHFRNVVGTAERH
jgi:hypothetical protein